MDIPEPEDEPCEQCGLCCRIFGPGITPTAANVYLWMEQGRTDILCWFVAFKEDGTSVPCTALSADDLGNVVSFGLRNPETSEYVTVCPFLRSTYQPWVFGETYFNRCPALKKADRKCRWPL